MLDEKNSSFKEVNFLIFENLNQSLAVYNIGITFIDNSNSPILYLSLWSEAGRANSLNSIICLRFTTPENKTNIVEILMKEKACLTVGHTSILTIAAMRYRRLL